jgi:hypothetical protein
MITMNNEQHTMRIAVLLSDWATFAAATPVTCGNGFTTHVALTCPSVIVSASPCTCQAGLAQATGQRWRVLLASCPFRGSIQPCTVRHWAAEPQHISAMDCMMLLDIKLLQGAHIMLVSTTSHFLLLSNA